ncbi:hypothetical protein KIN20_034301 [Parelaphostrongylus tenuis]|uniref:Uncharacterized protein n=1 Tax=Parelaphostrongylus tenuis TaxID=148309 RepID=A0AAD5RA18_PARTN|nr:hypothetical protein KIN20_034301 [Parelaphostrongylus tenuis]
MTELNSITVDFQPPSQLTLDMFTIEKKIGKGMFSEGFLSSVMARILRLIGVRSEETLEQVSLKMFEYEKRFGDHT